jgi:hypothetical protein
MFFLQSGDFHIALWEVSIYNRPVLNKKTIAAGLAAGVMGHIMQGAGAFLFFDRYYLQNTDLVRNSGMIVAVYYLALNLLLGVVIAQLSVYLRKVWDEPDWKVGLRAGFIIWIGSSPVFIIKRQIILRLSNWLLLEIAADLIVYLIMGAVAGFLAGRGIIDKEANS